MEQMQEVDIATACVVADASRLQAVVRNQRSPGGSTQMRSPNKKFECANDGGKSLDVTNMMDRRKLEVCVQETKSRWKEQWCRYYCIRENQ